MDPEKLASLRRKLYEAEHLEKRIDQTERICQELEHETTCHSGHAISFGTEFCGVAIDVDTPEEIERAKEFFREELAFAKLRFEKL